MLCFLTAWQKATHNPVDCVKSSEEPGSFLLSWFYWWLERGEYTVRLQKARRNKFDSMTVRNTYRVAKQNRHPLNYACNFLCIQIPLNFFAWKYSLISWKTCLWRTFYFVSKPLKLETNKLCMVKVLCGVRPIAI